jgi:dimethylaniline monooxygenase (N-oxide forming)
MDIAIIGFGVSGIACCRWALHYGFTPTVYDKNSSIGGAWFTKSYPNVQLQTNKYSYSFSDIPMKSNVSLYPTVDEVLNYLDEYVEYHDLKKYVNFSTEILSIEILDKKWKIKYIKNDIEYNHTYSYLVLCTGFYTDPLYKTDLPNVLSVSDFSPNGKYFKNQDMVFKNKDVVVIGNGPSGCDLTCLAIENDAKSVKLFYRKPRWIFSRYLFTLSLHFLTNRFFLTSARILPFSIVRIVLIVLFMIPTYWYQFKLQVEFPNEPVHRNNLTLNDKFYLYQNFNKFEYIKEPILDILENRVKSTKRLYNYDIVIDARGYKNEITLLGLDKIPMLYKHIIYPGINNLGIVGYAASFNWIMISDLQSRWLMEYFLGKIDIGSVQTQREYIGNEISNRADFHDLAYDNYEYCDTLAKDLKINGKKSVFSVPDYNEWSNN